MAVKCNALSLLLQCVIALAASAPTRRLPSLFMAARVGAEPPPSRALPVVNRLLTKDRHGPTHAAENAALGVHSVDMLPNLVCHSVTFHPCKWLKIGRLWEEQWVCCLLLLSVRRRSLITKATLAHHFVSDAEADFEGNGLAASCWQAVCVAMPEHEGLWPIAHILVWCLSHRAEAALQWMRPWTHHEQTLVWQSASPLSMCCLYPHSPLVCECMSVRVCVCVCQMFSRTQHQTKMYSQSI